MIRSEPEQRPRPIAFLAILFLLSLTAAIAKPQEPAEERPAERFYGSVQVTAVELVVDVRDSEGEVPEGLRATDLEVLEDARPVEIVGFQPLRLRSVGEVPGGSGIQRRSGDVEPPPWHLVAYFDVALSSSRSIRRSAEFLATQAGRLTGLGTVEIVVADSRPEVWLASTRSARLVEQTFQRLARELSGRDTMRQHRRRFLDTLLAQGQLAGARPVTFNANRGIAQRNAAGGPGGGAAAGGGDAPVLNEAPLIDRRVLVRWGATQELDMLRAQHDLLLEWLSQDLAPSPRALLLVNDGYDLDPQQFYLTSVSDSAALSDLTSLLQNQSAAPDAQQLARTLASRGWVGINLALGGLQAGGTIGAEHSGQGRLGEVMGGNPQAVAEMPTSLVFRPLAPLQMVADATGGETLTGLDGLPGSLDRLADRFLVTYQVPRSGERGLHRIEVRARRPGLTVRTQRWSGDRSLEGLASARARRLLAGGLEHGDLAVTAAVALEPSAEAGAPVPGRLQARVDLTPVESSLRALESASLRVTIAASFEQGRPFVHHQLVEGQHLAGLAGWTFGTPITLPARTQGVSVAIEILDSGAWGAARAAIVHGALPESVTADGGLPATATGPTGRAAEEPEVDLLPGRKAILLLPLDEIVLGRTEVATAVGSPEVSRVEFLLDGETVAVRAGAPFDARIDFGGLPEPRRLEVVARADDGRELGRDSRMVNEGLGAFRTRIIEPRPGHRAGPVDVEAEVKVPSDQELDRIEFFWNGAPVATVFEAPFRQRVMIPWEAPAGYLTAVAHLRDGSTAEDVVLLNSEGRAERIEVDLVELFTVVTDAGRNPVRGLPEEEFSVYEDRLEQELSSFREGAEAPLSLGIVIDTSASMFPVLREVQSAAIDFALLTLRPQDRALVVGFGSAPRLLAPLTGDRNALVAAVSHLQIGGWSPLTDAIVFSIAQMREVPGRRALVLITDGVGREQGVRFATCQRFVEKSGFPLYVILLPGDDPTARREGGRSDDQLSSLVASVGGRVFAVDDASRLGEVYRAIREELDSQYLLTYQPPERPGDEWREVRVEVRRPGLAARTIRGYFP